MSIFISEFRPQYLTMVRSPVDRHVASVVQHGVKWVRFHSSFKQCSEQLCVTEGGCEVQRSPSLRVSVECRGTMFQQSRYTALTAQHGLQGKSRLYIRAEHPEITTGTRHKKKTHTALCNAVKPCLSAASALAPFSNRMWTQSV